METAVIMGMDKLNGDMMCFEYMVFNEYGQLSLLDGKLVGQQGVSLEYQYELIDRISAGMGIVATIFVRDGDDFRRISTCIVDDTGKRVVDTFLSSTSIAYPSVHSGNDYKGRAVILGRDYLTHYRPIFAFGSRDIIGALFIGIEMTKIGQTISQNTVGQIILIVIIAITILLALIIVTYLADARTSGQMMQQSEEMHKVKDKLFSVVSHDLRGSMATLISIVRAILDNTDNIEKKIALLKVASAQIEKDFEMVDNLLRWAKRQMQGINAAPAYFDIQEESRTVTDNLQNMAVNKKISLINHIEKQQVYVDRDMLQVILRNLITNALKFTSSDGSVTLASELEDKMLIVSVKDTGTGMSDEMRDKLFNISETQSQRGTNNEKGTGLGLILVADFVKNIGGKIWLTTELGKGTTFYFSIPVMN
jgi:signal transduction histidine kinase